MNTSSEKHDAHEQWLQKLCDKAFKSSESISMPLLPVPLRQILQALAYKCSLPLGSVLMVVLVFVSFCLGGNVAVHMKDNGLPLDEKIRLGIYVMLLGPTYVL